MSEDFEDIEITGLITDVPDPGNPFGIESDCAPVTVKEIGKNIILESKLTLGAVAYFYNPEGNTAADLTPVKLVVAGGFYKKNDPQNHPDLWVISEEGIAYQEKYLHLDRDHVRKQYLAKISNL